MENIQHDGKAAENFAQYKKGEMFKGLVVKHLLLQCFSPPLNITYCSINKFKAVIVRLFGPFMQKCQKQLILRRVAAFKVTQGQALKVQ